MDKFVNEARLANLLKLLVVFNLPGGDPAEGAAAGGN
jgi:hypothetical protein